ncbi:MAG: Gfo/Idh/MocA family oxidoreductase [Polyangiales bacterium]
MPDTEGPIRYAVVGAGNIAQVAILPAFEHARENSQLVAIVSSDAEKREVLSRRYKVEHTGGYDDFEALLERARVDAVYIALPNSMHREFTERAARVGVHVLCEKPMAGTIEDCEAMIEVCKAHKVRLMVAYRLHYEEANLRALQLAQSGKIGQVRIFTSVFSQVVRPGDVRTKGELTGGALYDMGVYPINAARILFQEEPQEVLATSFTGGDEEYMEVDATTTAILRFSEGRVAQLTASLKAAPVSTYRIVGTEGDLRVEPAYGYESDIKHYLTVGDTTTETSYSKRDQFAPELITFSRCIQEEKDPETSGEEGLADIRVVRAIITSAQTGRAVRLTPFEKTQRPNMAQALHKPPVREVQPVNAPPPSVK